MTVSKGNSSYFFISGSPDLVTRAAIIYVPVPAKLEV
jgi:hypothetical protein